MSFDFSKEENLEYRSFGPVPAGSIVIVRMTLLDPGDKRDFHNPDISVTKNGLKQLYCQFEVADGQYKGVQWRQSMTLPTGFQTIQLTDNQKTACRIGGANLKAILEINRRPQNIQTVREFNDLAFPVKVKLAKKPYEKDGVYCWRNEIASIISQEHPDFFKVKQEREIINQNGATEGKYEEVSDNSSANSSSSFSSTWPPADGSETDADRVLF